MSGRYTPAYGADRWHTEVEQASALIRRTCRVWAEAAICKRVPQVLRIRPWRLNRKDAPSCGSRPRPKSSRSSVSLLRQFIDCKPKITAKASERPRSVLFSVSIRYFSRTERTLSPLPTARFARVADGVVAQRRSAVAILRHGTTRFSIRNKTRPKSARYSFTPLMPGAV